MSEVGEKLNSVDSVLLETDSEVTPDSLDPNRHNSNTPDCSRYILSGRRAEDGLFPHRKVFCNSYACASCGAVKVSRLRKAIEAAIKNFDLRVFATLTLSTDCCSPEQSQSYIRKVWNKHRTYQRRKFGRKLSFICVLEFQKGTGNAHLHILFNQFIPQTWLRESWQAVGGGRIVDIRRADSGAARYLVKYFVKSFSEGRPGPLRRISTSRDIRLIQKFSSESDFEFLKIDLTEARKFLGAAIKAEIRDGRNRLIGVRATRRLTKSE
jgi:hypothetical protein